MPKQHAIVNVIVRWWLLELKNVVDVSTLPAEPFGFIYEVPGNVRAKLIPLVQNLFQLPLAKRLAIAILIK
jgi:hypothetical protein